MALLSLEVTDFRCIQRAQFEFDQRCTLIAGENASGKTSLLEAIHVLSCGHSFRSNRQELLIRQGAHHFLTVGRVQKQGAVTILGVQGSKLGTEAHIGGTQSHGFAELAAALPTQVIDPEVHRLIEDGPKARRRFLDWGVFHVERQFVDEWRRYQRALRQRNAALKANLPPASVSTWDAELVGAGRIVTDLRQRYIDGLQAGVGKVAGALLDLPVNIEYKGGWNQELGLSQALSEAWVRDRRYGQTTVGPHRADLSIFVDGAPAKERISRGQQKLLASAMMLAQLRNRVETGSEPASLLLDDPAAELDVDNLKKLLLEVANVPAQLIVTSLDLRSVDRYLSGAVFHVERGSVSPVL
jgi:DNA replication and repair protein RecF